jgi:hypothetical protein
MILPVRDQPIPEDADGSGRAKPWPGAPVFLSLGVVIAIIAQ